MTPTHRSRWLVVSFAVAAISVVMANLARTASTTTEWAHLKSGKDVYDAACNACHGTTGTGNRQSSVAFETPLPDFTDCNFTSREPAADWYQIVRMGGPIRGFDQMMPAFGDALTPAQLTAAVAHVKDFCTDRGWPDGTFNLPKPLVTSKAYLEDEVLFFFSYTIGEPVVFEGKLVAEKRLGKRHQLELSLPFVVKQVDSRTATENAARYRWGEGMGDISLGYKVALLHSLVSGTIVSLSTDVLVPSGDEKDETGKGYFRFEPFVAVAQVIPFLGFLQFQGGAELSARPEKGAHELFWRLVYGHSYAANGYGRTWSPMVEMLGARELEDGAEVEWQVAPQLQVSLNQRQHILFNIGARIPLNDYRAENIQMMAYLLWDWFDGGFTDGW